VSDEELRRLLAGARRAVLATTRPDGRPHAVPITFALAGDDLVTAVDHKPKRTQQLQRLANIRAHPLVSVLADAYDDDWSRLWWVRVDGRARVVEGGPEHEAAVAALVDRYPQYRGRPPEGPAIIVRVEALAGWSAEAGAGTRGVSRNAPESAPNSTHQVSEGSEPERRG
jgi:PPOX class probable F420-dependent enzyme